MTITQQDLIDAARAIGVEINVSPVSSKLVVISDGRDNFRTWQQHKNQYQLMDLLWGLQLNVGFHYKRKSGLVEKAQLSKHYEFNNTFESFSTAIILAAAEIGRGMK